ncbi:unnamed protein product [Auanema sp. JU1783]|nr:unnamed protein product [Auanema sp. JU1783]
MEYTLGRVPIGSTDFSTREYSYDDVADDFNLRHFALRADDYRYKIKFIKMAQKVSPNKIRLVASPWSSPAWMKTNQRMSGGGALRDDYRVHRAYANYFVRFFEEYDKEGVDFWGVTIENEPTAGAVPNYKWQSLFFTATTERDFVRDYLGPTMKSHLLTANISIICLDDNRIWLPIWADIMFEDEKVEGYVDGIGVHWYGNGLYPAHLLTTTHQRHPNKFILATEACAGSSFPHGPILGDWYRAEQYAYDIITDLNNFVTGWMDWNLCLNMDGGPTWVKNYVDSPIIINSTANEFYKQPMFYAMGHFSKFIKPGSRRILSKVQTTNKNLQITAAVNKGQRVLVILNQSDEEEEIFVEDAMKRNVHLNLVVPARSISTVIWNKK